MPRHTMTSSLPSLATLVAAADEGLHPWVHEHVPADVRRTSLERELGFWLNTAAQDVEYAASYAEVAPPVGQPVEAYLDRWIGLASGGHVLAGPRYWNRDPNLPFVGVSASDRPLLPSDRRSLRTIAEDHYAPFDPGFVLVWSSDPMGAWPDTAMRMRQLAGTLGDLRRRDVPADMSTAMRGDTGFYEQYRRIHDDHVAVDPEHARRAECEDESDLQELAQAGLLHDVLVDGTWAGIVAAKEDDRRGIPGATVVELILSQEHRGRGYGKHLSALLARALPFDDRKCLMGTIHADNVTAYRAARGSGRVDVGGEIRVPV